MDKPKVVTLCGSTRFMYTFTEVARRETLDGKIVLTVHCGKEIEGNAKVRDKLNVLHLHKIDMADEILILNVGGYIGQGTQDEIDYARKLGKEIRFLESPT